MARRERAEPEGRTSSLDTGRRAAHLSSSWQSYSSKIYATDSATEISRPRLHASAAFAHLFDTGYDALFIGKSSIFPRSFIGDVSVAQPDRAADFGSAGWGF